MIVAESEQPPAMAGPDGPRDATGRAWTAEQERAIERRTGDLLLDAGAGSGKTSVLVERFVKAVLEDGVDVAAMLTITFTEKAAAELRDRIRSRLRALDAPEAARRTEGAFISTIHGFCARVLRANALAAGLDPQFAVLDRPQSEPLSAAAFDDALDELAGAAEGAVDLIADYTVPALRAAVLSVYAQLRSAGETAPRLPPVPPGRARTGRRPRMAVRRPSWPGRPARSPPSWGRSTSPAPAWWPRCGGSSAAWSSSPPAPCGRRTCPRRGCRATARP